MEYALFLGCTIPLKLPHFEKAFRELSDVLGLKYKEMEGAGCCPDPVATQSLNVDTWLALGARNLAIAERMGLDIMTICSGCFETLKTVYVLLEEDKDAFDRINGVLKQIGFEYKGTSKVLHFVELFCQGDMLEALKNKVTKPLNGLNIAAHYGCHLIRPSKIMKFDHPERPENIDIILKALGATPVDFATKLECCGFCARLQDEIGTQLVKEKMVDLKNLEKEVDAVVAVCPACTTQYDRKEKIISRQTGEELDIPVLYLPELIAIALGVDVKKLSLTQRSVKPTKLMEKLQI
ncbi:MAG: CoB--CoM heterodisulfide reductase iron-sulfur subunit B family protein [Promethearchaeota archaeon]